QFDETILGLDFGFNHPTALVEIGLRDKQAFLTERLYASGMTTADLIAWMDKNGISKGDPIYADAAEPDRIEELYRAGYNVLPAAKGPGSVNAGIVYCKGLAIHTRPQNKNINEENANYRWRVDKNGEALDQPEKSGDHAMDAIRYALFTHLKQPGWFLE
ncbi:MAG: terminase large subunit, partial [Alphaproteobacteria bacterium]